MNALLKAIKPTTEVYRGTISPELLQEYKSGLKQKEEALEEISDAWNSTKRDCWEKAYAELNLDPEGDYSINPLTGQITESVEIAKLESPGE